MAVAYSLMQPSAHAVYIGPTSGTTSYLDTNNWAGATIDDDIDDATTVLTGELTLTFDGNHATNAGAAASWGPRSPADTDNLILRSDGSGPHTIELQNDVIADDGINGEFTVTIGSTTAGQELFLDLGGVNREFKTGNRDRFDIVQPLVNAGNGFVFDAGLASWIILRGDNSASLGGIVNNEGGSLRPYHQNALGTAEVHLNDTGSLDLSNLSNGFNVSNNITSFDNLGGNTSSISVGSVTGGEISGNVTVGAGKGLNLGGDFTISGDLFIGAGARVRNGNGSDLTLTGDNNYLAGLLETLPNGSAGIFLGTVADSTYFTIDVNDAGDNGSFGLTGDLDFINAVLNFDTTDVLPVSQFWTIVEATLDTTYVGLDLQLDGIASFTDVAGVWTASNSMGNWTYTEATGQLEFEFVEPNSAVPEPTSFALLLGLTWFGLGMKSRLRGSKRVLLG
jgi:hypothetical protein